MKIPVGAHTDRNKGIRSFDWLLVIGVTLAPMTSLRIWKIGPAEIICLLWGLRYLIDGKIKRSILASFFFVFLISLLIGSLCGYFVAPSELRIADIITWTYFGVISLMLYKGLKENSIAYNEFLLYIVAKTSLIWYFFLYAYSIVISKTLLGIPLWYASVRFSGGAINPHQVAVFFCSIVFVFVRQIVKKNRVLTNSCFSLVCIYLLWQTASSTGEMALVIGMVVMLFLGLSSFFPEGKRKLYMVVIGFLVILIAIFGYSYFLELFMDWVQEDANGMGRLDIFSSFPQAFLRSPIFGLGPGVHARSGVIEFHNTYLEVLAATGVWGGMVFLMFSIILIKKVLKSDWSMLPIIISLYVFGFAGFAMRRLVYWCLLSFVFVLAEQIEERNQSIENRNGNEIRAVTVKGDSFR